MLLLICFLMCILPGIHAKSFIGQDGKWSDIVIDSPLSQKDFYVAFSDKYINFNDSDHRRLDEIYNECLKTPNSLNAHKDEIKRLWEKTSRSRNTFLDAIKYSGYKADAPELEALDNGLKFHSSKALTRIYSLQAKALSQSGESDQAIRNISEIAHAARMIIRSSATLVETMIGSIMFDHAINDIIDITRTAENKTQIISTTLETYPFLEAEDLSSIRFISAEYLYATSTTIEDQEVLKSLKMLSAFSDSPNIESILDTGITPTNFNRVETKTLLFETYKSIAVAIDEGNFEEVHRIESTAKEQANSEGENKVGKILVSSALQAFDKIGKNTAAVKTRNALLKYTFQRILKISGSTIDPYTNESYGFNNDTQSFYAAGEDKVLGTEDDIRLPGKQN